MLDSFELNLCNMQGKLFELSADKGFASESFIKSFMTSDTASDLDKLFHHMQWAGEGYILSRVQEENTPSRNGEILDNETLYWIGYIYRYWHFYNKETSKDIYRQAPVSIMRTSYLMFHTMGPEMAIDRLKEIYLDKKK